MSQLSPFETAAVIAQRDPAWILREIERAECERSLYKFLQRGWRYIDPKPFIGGWHLEAIAEHLEAVIRQQIRGPLIINVPPRSTKSSAVSVAFPAWVWAQPSTTPLGGPQVQFLSASYASTLSVRDAVKSRRLISSDWYQQHWGSRFAMASDQNVKSRYDNDQGGYRIATSVGGAVTGDGGDIIVIDDPHNAQDITSDAEREAVRDWWDQAMSTRLNDARNGAFIVVMQRLAMDDLTGHILDTAGPDAVHLMLPMEYEPERHCSTILGWSDPRKTDGELLMPERVGARELETLKRKLGPYGTAGQLQQRPSPRGGSIFLREWWQPWFDPDNPGSAEYRVYPPFELVVASLDTAYTERTENDPSAMTVWGVFRNKDGYARVMLAGSWEARAPLHAPDLPRLTRESDAAYRQRTQESWGVLERTVDMCHRLRVNVLLIEAKATGITVAQEMRRLHADAPWSTILRNPRGDKVARAYAAQPVFSSGMVYHPDRAWADKVITQMELFPRDKHDDLTDTATQALIWLRETGVLERDEEQTAALLAASGAEQTHRRSSRPARPLYPA